MQPYYLRGMDVKHQELWLDVNAKRLTLMCRHITQAEAKKEKTPKWLFGLATSKIKPANHTPNIEGSRNGGGADTSKEDESDEAEEEEEEEPEEENEDAAKEASETARASISTATEKNSGVRRRV